uniref:Acyl-coenzyme A oxidase n=1 Tax=Panagrellus redivivus TaxID=6233 RepID=A0A7E4ZVT0_PANRE
MSALEPTLIRPGDNPDITKERRAATVPVNALAAFIHGGADIVKRRKEIYDAVEAEPALRNNLRLEFLPREQRHEEQARRAVAMTDHATDIIDGSDMFGEGIYYQSLIMGRDLHALSLHYSMVLPAIQNQSDEEQMEEWLELIITRSIVATYAQTELGHGTNLSKLETTATYDPETEEFILHSPTITATKWWPGALGKSSNYAIVMAQLYVKGKHYGPHPFFVQLRHRDTHLPLPGITIGDIGPKLGINGSDNGFLRFNQFRIPRKAMFARNARVEKDGTYVPPKHAKLGFGAMVFVRSIMIKDQATQLAAAVTIATRYAAIRRQGEIVPNGQEVQILDYQTQQYRIFPNIAKTLVFLFAAYEIKDLYLKVTSQLQEGNVSLLPQLHGLSSGLKSIVSWDTAQGIEQCRLACGGHGYSQASGFPDIYSYAVGGCTYEGENIVMLLQVARGLVKLVPGIRSGNPDLTEITAYLGAKPSSKSNFTCAANTSPTDLVAYFEHAAREQLFAAYDFWKANESRYPTSEEAWNKAGIELSKASRLHVKAYLVRNYFNYVSRNTDSKIQGVLLALGKLYALDQLSGAAGAFLRGGFFNDGQISTARHGIYLLLEELRPNAVAIVDSFDISDRELSSVLGRRDGNVYENLLKWAMQSPLNESDISTAYTKHLKPMMVEARSKL